MRMKSQGNRGQTTITIEYPVRRMNFNVFTPHPGLIFQPYPFLSWAVAYCSLLLLGAISGKEIGERQAKLDDIILPIEKYIDTIKNVLRNI